MLSESLISRYLIESSDRVVQTFFDSGILSIATIDNVLIDRRSDFRVDRILSIINGRDWKDEVYKVLDNYRGSLQGLYDCILALKKLG